MNSVFAGMKTSVLFASVCAWIMAQTVKVVLGIVRERRFDFKWFIGTGGLPSSHAAGVSALAVSVGLHSGFDSTIFGVAAIFAFAVLLDAQTVRRAAGKQAGVLNRILDDIHSKRHFQEERLRELLGHTPVEVWTGVFMGGMVAMLLYGI